MSEKYTSRFITYDDPRLSTAIFDLPAIWWSRPYEYAWASSFVNNQHTVLDAGCGLGHPFKYYLSDLCARVYACDLDDRLLSKLEILIDIYSLVGEKVFAFPLEYLRKPILSKQDISATLYDDAMFDRIFCISVLEHMPDDDLLKALREFKRILKQDGLIAITLDYPYLDLGIFNKCLKDSGLAYAGEAIFDLPANALTTDLFPEFPTGLHCFRALVKKVS